MGIGALAVRGTIGPFFIGHGAQKLFGKFGGHGIEGTGGFFESLGLRPGKRHATAAGAAELGAGVLLTAGALTPVAATLVTSTMVTAIRKVHAPKGPWVTEGGYEYNAVLIAAAAALADHGPGKLSVDAALFPDFKGAKWALLAVAAGVAGSYLATEGSLADGTPVAAEPQGAAGLGEVDDAGQEAGQDTVAAGNGTA